MIEPTKHELLIEFISNPLFTEGEFMSSYWLDKYSHDLVSFRKFLQFNEQEILISPFVQTKKYISYEEIKKISKIYFDKYGLHREVYTKKVKAYGLIIFKYLLDSRKPFWLCDIAKYEFILFSQLWIDSYNNKYLLNQQPFSNKYLLNGLCRLGKFSFDIQTYMENPEKKEFLFKQETDKYLVFIGDTETPSVRTKSIDKTTYCLLRFCKQPRAIHEISSFLENKLLLSNSKSMNMSYSLVSLLESWKIITKLNQFS